MSGRTSIVMLSCALLDIVFMGMFTYASIEVFVDAVSDTLRSDLEDPVAYYQMVPMEDGADASKYILSGVKALWVAELKTSANDTQIVGMIALDLVPNSSTKTGEIRRMFVSPLFRRVGVASSLMRVCESRAKAYGLSRIVLNTSEYQTGAMRLYEGAGYRIYNRRELRSRSGLGVVKMIDYCKNLGK
ncbi:hypothetical protein VKT23_004331 [Stygiomarasmius scandens]|uniref:N-acetyltransferase domain-containing protein n=1 Tax=Marasmiellus scandens TaxID=2682957 RepID=A0ABR1JUQ0_9AGAR